MQQVNLVVSLLLLHGHVKCDYSTEQRERGRKKSQASLAQRACRADRTSCSLSSPKSRRITHVVNISHYFLWAFYVTPTIHIIPPRNKRALFMHDTEGFGHCVCLSCCCSSHEEGWTAERERFREKSAGGGLEKSTRREQIRVTSNTPRDSNATERVGLRGVAMMNAKYTERKIVVSSVFLHREGLVAGRDKETTFFVFQQQFHAAGTDTSTTTAAVHMKKRNTWWLTEWGRHFIQQLLQAVLLLLLSHYHQSVSFASGWIVRERRIHQIPQFVVNNPQE